MSSFGGSYGISGESYSQGNVEISGTEGTVQLSDGSSGITSDSLFRVDVKTGTVTMSSLQVLNSFDPGTSFATSNISGSPNITLMTANRSVSIITSNVGIGTYTPIDKLHVVGNVYASGNLVAANNSIIGGSYAGASIRVGVGILGSALGNMYSALASVGQLTTRTIKDDYLNPLSITSSSNLAMTANRIYLLSNNGVGIGTAAPTKELHVVGNTLVTQSITASSLGLGVNIPFTEQLYVQGSVTATSHLNVGGVIRGAGIRVGDSGLGAEVNQDANVQGNLFVNQDASMQNVYVQGTLTSSTITSDTSQVKFIKNVVVNADSSVTGNSLVTGSLSVSGNIYTAGYITATQGIDLGDNIQVKNKISSNVLSSYLGGSSIIQMVSNVGIGTTTVDSGYLMQVGGNAKVNSNIDATNVFATSVRSTQEMRSDGSVVATNMRVGNILNVSAQRIDTNYVTSNIDVQGNLIVTGDITGTNVAISTNDTGTSQLTLRNLNTTTGEAGLSVISGTDSNVFSMAQKPTGVSYIINTADADLNIIQKQRGSIRFLMGDYETDYFNVGTFGKIGIGISNPTYKLTMDGSFRLSGLFGDPNSVPHDPKFYFTDNITIPGTTPFDGATGRVNVKHSANVYMSFIDDTTVFGSITQVGGSTNYTTPSDYRIKSNVEPLSNALVTMERLEPVQFTFNSHPTNKVAGFIAHQVNEHIPQAVTGEKDGIDENGDIVIQTIDKSHMIPYLVSAIKELSSRVSSLENILSKE